MSFALGLTTGLFFLLQSGRSSSHISFFFEDAFFSSSFMKLSLGLSTGLLPLAQSGRVSSHMSSFPVFDLPRDFKVPSLGLDNELFPFAQLGLASFQYSDFVSACLLVSFFRREVFVHSGFGLVFGFSSAFSFGLSVRGPRSLPLRAHSGPCNQ